MEIILKKSKDTSSEDDGDKSHSYILIDEGDAEHGDTDDQRCPRSKTIQAIEEQVAEEPSRNGLIDVIRCPWCKDGASDARW